MRVHKKYIILGVFGLASCRTNKVQQDSNIRYETDQYSGAVYFEESPIVDSTDQLNELVNEGLKVVLSRWIPGDSRRNLTSQIASYFARRQLESWVIHNPQISSYLPPNNESVYKSTSNLPGAIGRILENLPQKELIKSLLDKIKSPIIDNKGLAANLILNGVEVGGDKLSHFFGLGSLYMKKYHEYIDNYLQSKRLSSLSSVSTSEGTQVRRDAIQSAIDFGVQTESGRWGMGSTGVFSNADLVANYQGMELFLAIEDGSSPYIGWTEDNIPYLKKEFDFRDVVNSFWNEAYNPNNYSKRLGPVVKASLYSYCDAFKLHPERFIAVDSGSLQQRFADKGIMPYRDRITYRLDSICREFKDLPEAEKAKYVQAKPMQFDSTLHNAKKSVGITILKENGEIETDQNIIENKLRSLAPPAPTCKSQIESAIVEHRAVRSKFNRLKIGVFNPNGLELSNEPFDVPLGTVGEQNCKSYKVEDPRIRKNYKYEIQICYDNPTKARYYYKIDYENSTIDSVEKLVDLVSVAFDGKYSYYSQPGYFEFEDTAAFVYRAVPVLCRWY